MTGPAESSQQPQPSDRSSTDRTFVYSSFTEVEARDTWTANAAYPADSPVPYALTAKAETLLGEDRSPASPLRNAQACDIATRPPQARPGLSGQARTYITEISVPPSDSGIQRLHARLKEPEPDPEAEL